MQDRIGTNDLANGAVRYGVYDADGNFLRYEWIRLEDEPLELETPLNKNTLLSDQAEQAIWPVGTPTNPTVDAAFKHIVDAYDIGDILTTVRVLAAPWHLCDGSTFSQTTYPDLYVVLGSTALPDITYSDDTGTYIKMADA